MFAGASAKREGNTTWLVAGLCARRLYSKTRSVEGVKAKENRVQVLLRLASSVYRSLLLELTFLFVVFLVPCASIARVVPADAARPLCGLTGNT